jgi:hypothetical protein
MGNKIKNSSKNFYSKTKLTLLLFAIFTVFIIPSISDVAFANHLSEKMKWQLVFISSQPGCSNYHYQMMNKFHYVSSTYLDEYGVENESYQPSCIPQNKYPQSYEKPIDLDLFILVYDKNLGEEILHDNGVGGYYKHFGSDITTNHFIVFCDCPDFNYSDPVWILSHELSHFSLFYYGNEITVIEKIVHANDESFDKCREHWETSCNSKVYKLKSDKLASSLSVMPIYQNGVKGDSSNSQPQEISDKNLELTKLIMQWWASGKLIYNEDYTKETQLLESIRDFYKNNGNVEFAELPIQNEVTWQELLYEESRFDVVPVLSHSPFKLKSLDEINEELDDNFFPLPLWFKQTVVW